MGCKVAIGSIADQFVRAAENADTELLEHLIGLVEGGEGLYADDFYSQIGRHPKAALVRSAAPQLF